MSGRLNWLNWEELIDQMDDEDVRLYAHGSFVKRAIIRMGNGKDYGIAAVHREGATLVFDVGQELEGV
jgi:hypothetical protein